MNREASGMSLPLPPEFLEAIAQRAAEIAQERISAAYEPWLTADQTAEYLACPKSRVYALVSARRIPHERDGSRLLFRRSELDDWVASGGGKRP
jgi:excisionase family DNA binding protein